jgi:hypothetical protein
MDPKAPNAKSRTTPQYAMYQRENFWKANDGEVPLFNTGKYTYPSQTRFSHFLKPSYQERTHKQKLTLHQIPQNSKNKPNKSSPKTAGTTPPQTPGNR